MSDSARPQPRPRKRRWDGYPSLALRDKLMNADFGSATIKITDKDDRFRTLLTASKPAGIPFDPFA
jgi:hypothetical protein